MRGPRRQIAPIEPDDMNRFDSEAFSDREVFRANYDELCRALTQLFDVESVLDIGSANGFVIDALLTQGKDVRGIELSTDVLPYLSDDSKARTIIGDATRMGRIGEFDLVTCIEVAEHIPPERSEALMDFIVSNTNRWLYFTAATPFQGGVGHINCRPHFFWLNGFRKRGMELDYGRTARLIEQIKGMKPCIWLPLNGLILTKHS